MPLLITWLAGAIPWLYVVVVNPTVGAATVAAVASIIQGLILLRHDTRAAEAQRRMDERMTERRQVYVIIHDDDGETLIVSPEERRELEREDDE